MPGVSNQECKRLRLSCGWEGEEWRFLSEWVLLRERRYWYKAGIIASGHTSLVGSLILD